MPHKQSLMAMIETAKIQDADQNRSDLVIGLDM